MPADTFGVGGALVIAIVGGAIGYYVRSFVSRESSARKEDWDQLRGLSSQINDLVDAARDYFCSPDPDERQGRKDMLKIQGMLKRTNQAIFTFSKSLNSFEATTQQVRFRQAITLWDGASLPTSELAMTDPAIVRIEEAANSLVGRLQLCYFRKYRQSDIQS